MEVHHHPDLHHKSKHWKEYLLEGLMIFIAVMLGFIAENIRENITTREHVRELTAQLVRDLKADTLQLNAIFRGETQIIKANDTLINLSQEPMSRENIEHLVRLVIASHNLWLFHPSSGAVAAIKNELHLKQFSSSAIIGYISEYEKHTALVHTVQDIALQYQRSFIDPFLLRHLDPANLKAAFNHLPLPNPEMRNLSQEDITQLGTDMVLIRINTDELLRDNRELKTDAVKLLQYVKKQYNLEED
ncbi:MAG TPA: hypothetical protein VMH01_06620 [Puia sp.]|nr:hypothetical protein [Puia sp.]